MKLGIMQPYFMPYLGYWQLINVVDQFIVYDDVNFIKGGWINRNRMLIQGKPQLFRVQMRGMSSFKFINEVELDSSAIWRDKLLKTIAMAYNKAPFFTETYAVMERIVNCTEHNLARYITNSIIEVCNYLGITTKLVLSSDLEQQRTLHAQARIIDICKRLGAGEYYNAIGGQELYSKQDFVQQGIELHFVQSHLREYKQFGHDFVPGLSILDIMMFNDVSEIQKMVKDYILI